MGDQGGSDDTADPTGAERKVATGYARGLASHPVASLT
jgi:hypothetical protein